MVRGRQNSEPGLPSSQSASVRSPVARLGADWRRRRDSREARAAVGAVGAVDGVCLCVLGAGAAVVRLIKILLIARRSRHTVDAHTRRSLQRGVKWPKLDECSYGTLYCYNYYPPLPSTCKFSCAIYISLRPPRCVSTGPVVVRLAGMAIERERERALSIGWILKGNFSSQRSLGMRNLMTGGRVPAEALC